MWLNVMRSPVYGPATSPHSPSYLTPPTSWPHPSPHSPSYLILHPSPPRFLPLLGPSPTSCSVHCDVSAAAPPSRLHAAPHINVSWPTSKNIESMSQPPLPPATTVCGLFGRRCFVCACVCVCVCYLLFLSLPVSQFVFPSLLLDT